MARRCVGKLHQFVLLGDTIFAKFVTIWIGDANPYSKRFGRSCVTKPYNFMKSANTPLGHSPFERWPCRLWKRLPSGGANLRHNMLMWLVCPGGGRAEIRFNDVDHDISLGFCPTGCVCRPHCRVQRAGLETWSPCPVARRNT